MQIEEVKVSTAQANCITQEEDVVDAVYALQLHPPDDDFPRPQKSGNRPGTLKPDSCVPLQCKPFGCSFDAQSSGGS